MSDRLVRIGFEVGTGAPVDVPLAHTIATGQTQMAGKTTAFEGLIARAGLPAIAFRTKRGEGAFADATIVPPYFKERADWQFVESIVGAVLRQGMRFERAWIIKAARNCESLAEVRRRTRNLMSSSKRSMDKDIYMLLGEYLDLVLPVVERLPRLDAPRLGPGTNVMDLEAYPLEVQMLVVQSTIGWVYEKARNLFTVLPESWEFVPQKRDSPVKAAAIGLARKGLALGNRLLVDSQDLAGLDKEIVRQCRVYLLGVQRERNEIKRTLDHIPAGMKRPRSEDLAQLKRGQFFVCWDDQIFKTYVQPAWASEAAARQAAIDGGHVVRTSVGQATMLEASGPFTRPTAPADPQPAYFDHTPPADHNDTEEEPVDKEQEKRLEHLLGRMEKVLHDATADKQPGKMEFRDHEVPSAGRATTPALPTGDDEEMLFRRFRDRLLRDPIVLKVLATEKRIEVVSKEHVVEADGDTMNGRIALLVKDGFFDEPRSGNGVWTELKKKGWPAGAKVPPGSLYAYLSDLARDGFLTIDLGSKTYTAVDGAARRVKVK